VPKVLLRADIWLKLAAWEHVQRTVSVLRVHTTRIMTPKECQEARSLIAYKKELKMQKTQIEKIKLFDSFKMFSFLP